MDCDSIRAPPKASKHSAVNVPQTTSQLDLTPEKPAAVMAVGRVDRQKKQADKNAVVNNVSSHRQGLTGSSDGLVETAAKL